MHRSCLVNRVKGAPRTAGDSVLRFVGYCFGWIAFGLGYLWALFDAQNQGWHARIVGTYVFWLDPAARKKKCVTI
jgi:uncharacterized RDD family membrane protein YckC